MEHLWETHGRRLSEAGLRRGSDNSVVLTEDTDSFIIGDRVWVGGTKPGQIAYIGETQFAPGDWAGIVLDEPIGKNDGSVAGSRYFQCEPKRGIFSRLSRLTRQPLADVANMSPNSPTESTRCSLNKSVSPSLNTSTTSLSSVSHKELRIGERVIVSSSQGSKTGVLRFLGTTEFAPGEWCGVELDEPQGKNDGSVNETRYFECHPKHGLFAPVHKVSRSPSNKRSMCMVHRPTGAALNSSLRKMGSRESLVSVSSIASTSASIAGRSVTSTSRRTSVLTSTPAGRSMQDILKDKQQEIETLRKERNLERERVTKAASQADQAEQSAITLKKEYDKFRQDMEKTVQDSESALAILLDEKKNLGMQLEEEKRRCEDLLFRFEEESIYKDDIQVINVLNENKIKEIEKQLSEERERVVLLEKESTKLFEAEEELARLRVELQTIQEKNQSKDLIEHTKNLEVEKTKLVKQMEEKDVAVQRFVEEMNDLKEQLNRKEQESPSQKDSETCWQRVAEEAKRVLQEKCDIIDKMEKEFALNADTLTKEIQRLKKVIESITNQTAKEKNDLITKYQKALKEKENVISSKTDELSSELEKQLGSQKVALQQLKDDNVKHINQLSASFKEQLTEKENHIQRISSQLEQKIAETDKLIIDVNALQNSHKGADEEIRKLSTHIEELNTKLKLTEENNSVLNIKVKELHVTSKESNTRILKEKFELEQKVATLSAKLENSILQLNKLDEGLKAKETELAQLRCDKSAEIEEITSNLQGQIENKCKYIQDMSADATQKSLRLTNLEKAVADLKSRIVNKDEEIKSLLEKISELQDSLTLSEQTKFNLESELGIYETNVQDLNHKLTRDEGEICQLTEQKKKLEEEISNIISTSADSSDQLTEYNEDLRNKEKELDVSRDKIFSLEKSLSATEAKLQAFDQNLVKTYSLVEKLKAKNKIVNSQMEVEKNELQSLSGQLIEFKKREKEHLEVIKKNENVEKTLIQKATELNQLAEALKKAEQDDAQLNEKMITLDNQYRYEKLQLKKSADEVELRLVASEERLKVVESMKNQLEVEQNINKEAIKELHEKLDLEGNSRSRIEAEIEAKQFKIDQMDNQITELRKEKDGINASFKAANLKYGETLTELILLKSTYSNTTSETSLELANVKKQLINAESVKDQLENSLSELNAAVNESRNQLTTVTQNAKLIEDKLRETEIVVEGKNAQILKLEKAVEGLKEEKKSTKQELSGLQQNLSSKEQEVINEVSALKDIQKTSEEKFTSNQVELKAKQDLVKELECTIKQMKKSKESAHISNAAFGSEIKQKSSEMEASLRKNNELQESKELLEALVEKQKNELNLMETLVADLQTKLTSLEASQTQKSKLDQDLKNKEIKTKQSEIDEVRKENKNMQTAKNNLEKILMETEEKLEVLSNSVESKEKETDKNAQNLVEKVNLICQECSHLKESRSRLEQENKQLMDKYAKSTESLHLMNVSAKNKGNVEMNANTISIQAAGEAKENTMSPESDYKKLLEENEMVKGQIDFLNSVIVDMQRKNETLLCKIELLELGMPVNEADDYNRSTLEKRHAPPRMFCDICDQFDLHETEDCPRQSQEYQPEPKISRPEKKPRVERAYCENCEVFGHDTQSCDDAETF
ncbi:restin homolog isoform X2 [Belonocnema kinseyi]|uniref:restin homolog isoform X2 n=1 Tax=Belonocnema kinseyi TaxID=2817044 RepID=UPI00143D5B2A|nr:restin homolog isoform X2 [Belonocnema kinseyi]